VTRADYLVVASPQSSLTANYTSNVPNQWISIGDALDAASQPPTSMMFKSGPGW
jgi:hypothetical protein